METHILVVKEFREIERKYYYQLLLQVIHTQNVIQLRNFLSYHQEI